jgi:hypothetical protein
MRPRHIIAALLLLAPAADASGSLPTLARRIVLRPAPGPVGIDGVVDPHWASADSAALDFQLHPYYGRNPSVRTVAKVLSSPDALYCLMICYQPVSTIEANTGLHDQHVGDVVSIMLDTFNDRQTAYKFSVSASGVRGDARMLDDGRNRDYSYDGVWTAASAVTDSGYVVEMEIPYRTIKHDGTSPGWGVEFDRWIPQTKEDLYWSAYEQNEGMRVSRFGRLEFDGVRPSAEGLNLELYPVAIARTTYNGAGYDTDPDLGLDLFYNPSEQLTLLLTANPDFAQIEADPFDFNISQYESYYAERRPFFTEGSEIFNASGRQNNTGFYRPMELFYSRRIGRSLPDGSVVPLIAGTKGFGRATGWEYGGFVASTAEQEYTADGEQLVEERALFASARIKRTIIDNSSVGGLFVSKQTATGFAGVLDIDGAFRTTDWQLSYQAARSINDGQGDYAFSAGFVSFGRDWINLGRARAVGKDFDVSAVGFVPWRGTAEATYLTGPTWYFATGYISQITTYAGLSVGYEDVDLYTDWVIVLGFNMQLRDNWGYEINITPGRGKDRGILYNGFEASLGSWFNVSAAWEGNLHLSYRYSYNYAREYLASSAYVLGSVEWRALPVLQVGTSVGVYPEWKPAGGIEEVTYNTRPFLSMTPFNNLNVRMYADMTALRSTGRLENLIAGLLFSYNFLPKSWIYLALNEVRDRPETSDAAPGDPSQGLRIADRAGVFKVKYLYYI